MIMNDTAYAYSYPDMHDLNDACVTIMPILENVHPCNVKGHYGWHENLSASFINDVKSEADSDFLDDLFRSKVVQSQDRIGLILEQVKQRQKLASYNIKSIYDDLFRVEQFRSQIPYPQNYNCDSAWSGLNDSELKLRQELRHELNTVAKDMAFLSNDLRNSLLEFKLQNSKSGMMNLNETSAQYSGGLDEIIGPDGSIPNEQGEKYDIQDQ